MKDKEIICVDIPCFWRPSRRIKNMFYYQRLQSNEFYVLNENFLKREFENYYIISLICSTLTEIRMQIICSL